jgi:hypothetical protein
MVAILAVGFLSAWIVSWEQLRVQRRRALAMNILAEAAHDRWHAYRSTQEAMEESRHVSETARMWADGWPTYDIIAGGLIVDIGVVGLILAISGAVALKVRRGRRE